VALGPIISYKEYDNIDLLVCPCIEPAPARYPGPKRQGTAEKVADGQGSAGGYIGRSDLSDFLVLWGREIEPLMSGIKKVAHRFLGEPLTGSSSREILFKREWQKTSPIARSMPSQLTHLGELTTDGIARNLDPSEHHRPISFPQRRFP
jgi:hypothetical protein